MTCRCCLVALLILIAGCSGYRRVSVPGTEGGRIRFTPAGIALTAVIATFLLAASQIHWQ
jgi:hypothetical protein